MRELMIAAVMLSASLTGCIGSDEPVEPPTNETPNQAPDTDGLSPTDHFSVTDCQELVLVWTPPLEDLDDVAGPWTPAEGPVPDRGVFILAAIECPDATINGNSTGEISVGLALVVIEEPDEAHGIEANVWVALSHRLATEPLAGVLSSNGFAVAEGNASLDIETTPAGWTGQMVYETPNGTITANGGAGPGSDTWEPTVAQVPDHADPFSVLHGPETIEASNGTARVQSTGDTWVSRLGLEPTPFQYQVVTRAAWDFVFEQEASAGAGGGQG